MIKLLTIIGARPQIIKAAAISRAVKMGRDTQGNLLCEQIEEKILHTGQHYDENMSGGFFKELGIPEPDYNLQVGSGKHGEQTAKMIDGIEKVLVSENFDGMILYGDTNSTLAGAVAASKLHIPVFHIEAGLRSYNMSMPEEVNRIVCDQLSSILFSPTQTGIDNVTTEGLVASPAKFKNGKNRKVVLSGDVMFDNSMYFANIAEQKSTILQDLQLNKKQFINLVHAGALDCFNHSRKAMVNMYETVLQKMNYIKTLGSSIINTEFDDEEYNFDEISLCEKESLGFNLKYSSFSRFVSLKEKYNCVDLSNCELNKENRTIVTFRSIRVIKTKKNDEMAFVSLFDDSMEIEGVLFPLTYNKFKNFIKTGQTYLITYKLENRNEKCQAIIESIYNLT